MLDIKELRARLANRDPANAWRSLDELADEEDFRAWLKEEFPRHTAAPEALDRRQFLKLLAAPLALAGLAACRPQPLEKILPYNREPEGLIPGEPLYFATAIEHAGYGVSVLVKSREGRPVKVEGNPDHPASLGASDVFAQASLLDLYDPQRAQVLTKDGQISTWGDFRAELGAALSLQAAQNGAGLRLLTETITSPTLAAQIGSLLEAYPQAKWYAYEPAGREAVREGARMAFGEALEPRYHFERAEIILSLDADFCGREPGSLRYVRDFSSRRQARAGETEAMNRLYAVESSPSNSGAIADHRLPLQAAQVEVFARRLANRLGLAVASGEGNISIPEAWMEAVVEDLEAHAGKCLVLAGAQQPPAVHALAHAINAQLGNIGTTVTFSRPAPALPPEGQSGSLEQLEAELQTGDVALLVILGGNPAYSAPADANFGQAIRNARQRIYFGPYANETSKLCQWHVPGAHPFEMWSDTRTYDGRATLIQPLIEPLYGGRSRHELLGFLLGESEPDGYEILRSHWQAQFDAEADFERIWRRALHDGWVEGTEFPAEEVRVLPGLAAALQNLPSAGEGLEIIFAPDAHIWDGRYANNAWLQELPKPLTRLTWDNAALVGPATAQRWGLQNGDVVELRYQGRSVSAPVWILPGQASDSVSVHLGYGRENAMGTGFNAYLLRTSAAPWFDYGLEMHKTGGRYELATTQHHHSMEGRHLVRTGSLDEFLQDPGALAGEVHSQEELPSLYPEYNYDQRAWGMAINLSTCIGCNACVIACQAENNIPVVGKEQVLAGREMHWLRIDRYFEGQNLDEPEVHYQPVPCMHCENAPCEPVCPVEATVHSAEGLNEMVYNRCVGTRYCSNNCPYKVRRFNFLQFSDQETIPLKLMRNPEVSVRVRGVMEKCTYCVQRISKARIDAEAAGRPIQDGEVKTACQQACPANAIVFGDQNDEQSQVHALKQEPHHYALLSELNTRPRTTYLAKIRNPHPRLVPQGGE